MPAVGQAALQYMVLEIVRHLGVDDDAAQRQISTGHPLGKGDHIRFHIKILPAKHLAGPAKSCHDFIADHEDTVCIAQCTNPFHIALRRQDDTIGPDNTFHDEGRNMVGPFKMHLLFQCFQEIGRASFVIDASRVAVLIHMRIHEMNKPVGTAYFRSKTPPVAGGIAGP